MRECKCCSTKICSVNHIKCVELAFCCDSIVREGGKATREGNKEKNKFELRVWGGA